MSHLGCRSFIGRLWPFASNLAAQAHVGFEVNKDTPERARNDAIDTQQTWASVFC